MKLSVVIPVYNAELYLVNCLNSVVNQTFKDFEVILIDDGSTDHSSEICYDFIQKDSRFKYKRVKNGGPARARNIGISIARGEYIGFVDADDTIESNMYEKLIALAENFKVDMVICGISYTDSNFNKLYEVVPNIPLNEVIYESQIKEIVIRKYYNGDIQCIPALLNKLYSRRFISDNGLKIDESRVRAEDYWFNMYALKKAKRIMAIGDKLYNYNSGNQTSVMSSFRDNQFEMFVKTREELLKLNIEFRFDINYDLFDSSFIQETNSYILNLMKREKNKKYDKVRKILSNQSYRNAIENCNNVTKHIKLINWFVKKRIYVVAYMLFKIWMLCE